MICQQSENEKYLTCVPEIIFEILYDSTAKRDQTIKYELYEQDGVGYYVIIDGAEKVAKVHQLKNGKYIKVRDTTNENVVFDVSHCGKLSFDFSQIWI